MARLIPKVNIEDISVKSERDVARFLVDLLPDDCVIYHSYPWLRVDRNDKGNTTLKEGETDFVVILPSHGILVLEVKGGEIRYDSETREWSRVLPNGNLRSIQDPFEQARRNTHFLETEIKQKGYNGANSLPFGYGYAAVFPDSEYSGETPVGSTPSVILSASDLPKPFIILLFPSPLMLHLSPLSWAFNAFFSRLLLLFYYNSSLLPILFSL